MEVNVKKRPAEEDSESLLLAQPSSKKRAAAGDDVELTLFVRWFSVNGKTKVNQLMLRPIESVDNLEGVSKALIARAYPPANPRPDHIISDEFYRFTPMADKEFLSCPGDVARTVFRLVATYEGWEYTILEREQNPANHDPDRRMLVTVVEFESSPLLVGQFGLRISLVAYPVISVQKKFLAHIENELKTNPNFKGLLS